MNVKINDLMVTRVITMTPHQTAQHARELMEQHGIQSIPVLRDGEPVGIVTASDLLSADSDSTPASKMMSTKLYTVPQYEKPSIAARIMRNHKLHHLLVTHEKQLVGVLSTYDLLRLVEDHRFTMKNPPTETKRKGGKRGQEEKDLADNRQG